ncbi:hypothetical protein C8Q77DRAFT_1156828 [Trametes polyzona]|nr:hypothetical protein C8Q77DRAFT_1156828 [Trametes polyzona]
MSRASRPEIESLNSVFGAFLLGNFVALIFYGVIVYQAILYAFAYQRDPVWLKSVVASAVLLETISAVLGMHSCYDFYITHHSRPLVDALSSRLWSLSLYPLALGLIMATSQRYEIGPRTQSSLNASTLQDLISKAFLLALIADLMLTSLLIRVLHRSRTGIKRTNSIIDLLIIYSVRTGLLTGIFDLLTTIFAFTWPTNNVYMAFGLPGARMYAITLLSALNSRQWLSSRWAAGGDDVSQFDDINFAEPTTTLVHSIPRDRLQPQPSDLDGNEAAGCTLSRSPWKIPILFREVSLDILDANVEYDKHLFNGHCLSPPS